MQLLLLHLAIIPFSNFKFPYFTVSNQLLSSISNTPNVFWAKIEITSKLNLSKWRSYSTNYHDKVICESLQYGWSINYYLTPEPEIPLSNHLSVLVYKSTVDEYTSLELAQDITQGPFDLSINLSNCQFIKLLNNDCTYIYMYI